MRTIVTLLHDGVVESIKCGRGGDRIELTVSLGDGHGPELPRVKVPIPGALDQFPYRIGQRVLIGLEE